MLNTQPAERQELREDGTLEVVELFDTIQGEGPFAGLPATFIRLAGCDLTCSLCDTDYTTGRKRQRPSDILVKLFDLPTRDLIVLTGGEPFRQDFSKLLEAIWNWDHRKAIQVETNGTLWIDGLSDLVTIVCSPKTPKVHDQILARADAFKYIIQDGFVDDNDGLPTKSLGLGRPARPPENFNPHYIYVQPCDEQDSEKNLKNTVAAVNSCLEHGYRLCLQVHKLVGLP